MINYQHKELAAGKWFELSLSEQMANIGSEVSRALNWRGRDEKLFLGAIERALELIDLTLKDSRMRHRLKEISRAREVICDTVFGIGEWKTSLEDLNCYFFNFALASRQNI